MSRPNRLRMRLTGPTAAPGRGRAATAGLGLLAVLTATPGVHLFERWMAPAPAFVVSHGLAVVILGLAVVRWRAGRRTRGTVPLPAGVSQGG